MTGAVVQSLPEEVLSVSGESESKMLIEDQSGWGRAGSNTTKGFEEIDAREERGGTGAFGVGDVPSSCKLGRSDDFAQWERVFTFLKGCVLFTDLTA